jgi:hypothetical protein
LLHTDTKGIQDVRVDSIAVAPASFPSVDDVYLVSCAIVWQNDSHIYYGQTRDEHIMTNPSLRVCTDAEARCMNLNVCYKAFRRDSIGGVDRRRSAALSHHIPAHGQAVWFDRG